MKMTKREEEAMVRRIEEVRRRVAEGRPDPHHAGPVDPYDVREATADALQGQVQRNPEAWVQVMEHHGFVWYEPRELDRFVGPRRVIPSHLDGVLDAYGRPIDNSSLYVDMPHVDGQWRRDRPHPMPAAFTIADLFALFGTPEEFDTWIRGWADERRAARAGIRIARR